VSQLLGGKCALVIGGGSGIGRAVVDAFAGEGANVTVLERDTAKCEGLERELPAIRVVNGDATSAADNDTALAAALGAAGELDVLVSCVGLFDYRRGLADLSAEQLDAGFDELFAVNVKSMLLSVRAALDALRAAKGSVILTASTSSFVAGRGGILYVASKFAVRGLVVSLAHELGPDIRVNGVAPGGTVGTDLRGLAALGEADRSLGAAPDRTADVIARTPLGIALTAADVAASYVFLASPAARGITGTFLHPDGGVAS